MRELKFRAWDKERKRMFAVTILNASGAVSVFIDDELYFLPAEQIELMQYTGLKDKNGKEIYEGDIVREVIDTDLKDIDGEYEYIVQWDDDFKEFTIQTTPKNKVYFHDELYQLNASREIIGNIHENPELCGDENEED